MEFNNPYSQYLNTANQPHPQQFQQNQQYQVQQYQQSQHHQPAQQYQHPPHSQFTQQYQQNQQYQVQQYHQSQQHQPTQVYQHPPYSQFTQQYEQPPYMNTQATAIEYGEAQPVSSLQQHANFGLQHLQADFGAGDQAQASQWQSGYMQEQATGPLVDYQDLHLAQLQLMCRRYGSRYPDKASKSQLIEMLPAGLVLEYHDFDKRQLNQMRRKRVIAWDKEKCNKADLIKVLQDDDEAHRIRGQRS